MVSTGREWLHGMDRGRSQSGRPSRCRAKNEPCTSAARIAVSGLAKRDRPRRLYRASRPGGADRHGYRSERQLLVLGLTAEEYCHEAQHGKAGHDSRGIGKPTKLHDE